MNLAYADRDFYYGDPRMPPEEPIRGLLSKEYARERAKLVNAQKNDAKSGPGDPYPFQGGVNPYTDLLQALARAAPEGAQPGRHSDRDGNDAKAYARLFFLRRDDVGERRGQGRLGGFHHAVRRMVPAFIAGKSGIGLSQRMQSFVLDPAENPFNVGRAREAASRDADAFDGTA